MSSASTKLQSLQTRWAAALDATEPSLDLNASRERWVKHFDSGVTKVTKPSGWRLAVAMAAVVLSVVALFVAWPWIVSAPTDSGARMETAANERIPLNFTDGSQVIVHSESQVHLRSVDPQGARVDLERGTLSASIVPRPDTHWSFHSGPFLVEVTGTELRITWRPETQQFEVSVEEGSVRVTGPMVEGGRSVKAGERCHVDIPAAHLEVTRLDQPTQEVESTGVELTELPLLPHPPSASAPADARAAAPPPTPPSWIELEQQARYWDALRTAEQVGLERIYASGSANELLTLARIARLSRGDHPEVSRRALTACRDRFPGSSAAAQAAFLLGRAAAPAAAAQWFTRYLQEAPNGPFAREAAGRLVESHHRAGNLTAARQAAAVYLQRYPNGPHAAFARSIIDAPSDDG